MRRILTALMIVAASTAGLLAQDKAAEGDLPKLQGKWSAKAGPEATEVVLILEAGKITFEVPVPTGETKAIVGSFTIDETTSPKSISWTGMKIDDRSLPDVAGIYALEGDTLKIAGGNGQGRPKEFVEKGKEKEAETGRANTMVFTRVKPEEKKDEPKTDETKK